jgi:hypothetical protein
MTNNVGLTFSVGDTISQFIIRVASHYGRRSRGRRFSPIKLQETKHLASRPFILWPKSKVQRPSQFRMPTFDEGDKLLQEVWVGWEWNPNYG